MLVPELAEGEDDDAAAAAAAANLEVSSDVRMVGCLAWELASADAGVSANEEGSEIELTLFRSGCGGSLWGEWAPNVGDSFVLLVQSGCEAFCRDC